MIRHACNRVEEESRCIRVVAFEKISYFYEGHCDWASYNFDEWVLNALILQESVCK